MVMWRMKDCPKCGGDFFLDIDGSILIDHCLQCGYIKPRPKEICPHCSIEMVIEEYGDSEFYYCLKCGYTNKLDKVGNH